MADFENPQNSGIGRGLVRSRTAFKRTRAASREWTRDGGSPLGCPVWLARAFLSKHLQLFLGDRARKQKESVSSTQHWVCAKNKEADAAGRVASDIRWVVLITGASSLSNLPDAYFVMRLP